MRCVQVEKRDTRGAAALTYVTDCLGQGQGRRDTLYQGLPKIESFVACFHRNICHQQSKLDQRARLHCIDLHLLEKCNNEDR